MPELISGLEEVDDDDDDDAAELDEDEALLTGTGGSAHPESNNAVVSRIQICRFKGIFLTIVY